MSTGSARAATPLCFGVAATIVGTEGPDEITTNAGVRDVVYAGGGDDWVRGADRQAADPGDLICGGIGNDNLRGGLGNDKINGGDGHDTVIGYFGVDVLQGNAGNDHMNDADGDDDWYDSYDPGTDTMRGGGGNDLMQSVSGADKVYGDEGADQLWDYSHAKTYLYGGPGDDYINATGSNWGSNAIAPDNVFGDGGIDTAVANRTDVVNTCERISRVG
jgi:Ca2+-binding RTX toxin-like protein